MTAALNRRSGRRRDARIRYGDRRVALGESVLACDRVDDELHTMRQVESANREDITGEGLLQVAGDNEGRRLARLYAGLHRLRERRRTVGRIEEEGHVARLAGGANYRRIGG